MKKKKEMVDFYDVLLYIILNKDHPPRSPTCNGNFYIVRKMTAFL